MAVAALLAIEVARLTVAAAYAETRPRLAESLAPQQPDVLASLSMAQVGQAAAAGQTPPQSTIARLRRLTRVAPLEAEPFLVHGAIAQRSGDVDRAEQLLLDARRRDPRSAAARYLLADTWLRQDRVADGLGEMAILSRLLPGSSVQLVPALAEYAHTPGASERLKRILIVDPRLKRPLLTALAGDPDNLELILELEASVPGRGDIRSPPWQAKLLGALIRRGDYDRAYALWQRLAGFEGERPLLFNGEFRAIVAPPPFNWTFASTGAGLAEPGNGSMRVLYYGRQNATLASQQLLLPPGSYRFSTSLSGTIVPGALVWTLSCAGDRQPLMTLELGSETEAQHDFAVPESGCLAQTLSLGGRALDMPRESDLRIGPASIERIER